MKEITKNKKPLVSVNMVSFNSEKYIAESIQSILNQTYKNFELIIVNDGSTDNTLREINNFNDSRIVIINNKNNFGIPHSRNIALRASNGKYIAIQDSDDVSLKERLHIQVNYLENNLKFGLVGSLAIGIDQDGKTLNRKQSLGLNSRETKVMIFFRNCFTHSTIMYRKNKLKKIYFDQKFKITQDYDAIIKIARDSKIKNIDEALIMYRFHENSISQNLRDKEEEEKIIIGSQLEKLGISNTKKNIIAHKKFKIRTIHKNLGLIFAQLGLLEKLLLGNQEHKILPEPEFSNRLVRYWNNIMSSSSQYSLKLLGFYINSRFIKLSNRTYKSHILFFFRCLTGFNIKF